MHIIKPIIQFFVRLIFRSRYPSQNEELRNFYSPPNIIRTIESRRMRWGEHGARFGVKRNAYMILVGKPEGKRPHGLDVGGWIIMKWILQR
jgi:hypothetical protein